MCSVTEIIVPCTFVLYIILLSPLLIIKFLHGFSAIITVQHEGNDSYVICIYLYFLLEHTSPLPSLTAKDKTLTDR